MMKGSWIRLVALCVAQVFMCSSFSAYAAPVRGDIPRTSPGISVQAKAAPSIDSIRIDPRFGRIVESQTFENSPYTIVHIQDLHAHAEAQENIARILHSLYKEYGIRQVALEGSEGPVYSFFFSTFPDDEVRVRWAEQALDQAVITGPEKVAIADQLPLELYGVEDRAEYVRDFLFFQQVHTAPEEARAEFRQALGQLEILEQEVYPEVVKTKLALFSRKAEGSSPSSGLFAELIESSRELQIPLAESYPSLEAYSGMQELEGSLDEESFQKQLKQLVTQLSQSEAAPAVRQELLQLVSQVSGGQTGAGAFAGKLVGLVERAQLPIDSYPAVYAMAEHEALSMRVRPESLLAEVDRLQEKILQRLFETEDQRQVHELRKGARILEKVVSAEASPKDWQEFRTLSSDASLGALCKSLREFLKKYQVGSGSEVPKKPCKEWAGLIKASEGFYEVGEKRNESLVANTLAFLQRSGAQTGVLLTGGFHTKGMTELLAQRGISYVVVAPRVTQFAGPDLYLERMLAQDVSSSTTSRKPTVATSSRDKLATAHWLAQNPSISADQAMQSVHNQTQEILRLLGEGSDRQAVLNTWWQRLKEGIQTYPQLTGVDELETELGPGRSAVILFDPDFATYLVKHVIEPLMEKSDDILGLDSFQVAMAEASPKSLTDFDEVWELIRDEWQAYESWVDFDAGDLGVLAALWPNGLPQDVISSADLVAKAPERLQEVYDLVRAHIQATEKPLLLATAERSSSERSVLGPKGGTRADDDARRRRREEVRQQTQAAISQKNHGAEVSNGDLIPPQEDRLLLLCDLMLKSGKGGNFAELPRQNQRDIYQDRLRKELGAQILDGGLTLEDLDKDIREAEVLVANDLLRLLAEIYGIENIEAVEIHFPPSFTGQNVGTERGVLLPITALRRALASGVRFDGSSIEGMGYLDDGNRAAEIRPGSARIEEVNGRKILILEAVPKRMAEFESREGIERQPALEPRPMAPVALDQDRQAQYQQIVDYLNSHEGLDTITVFLPDLSGENREAVITQAQLEDAIQKGEELRVLVSEFGQTDDLGPLQLLTDRNTEGWTVTFDPATFAIVDLPEGDDPTGQRRTSLVATMDVGEIRDREGVIFMGSSRAIAEQIEKILAEMGMKASAATEMEWFWWIAPKGAEGSALYAEAVREVYEQDHLTPHDDGFVEALVVRAQSKGLELNPSPYFGAPYKWPNEYYDIGIDFLKAMGSWGEITEYLHIEVATGQVESPQGHGTPWEAARNTLMRKWVIRKIAERRNEEMAAQRAQAITLRAQGKTVEVPPEREIQTCTLDKPAEGVNGSGMHVHQATVVSLPEGPLPGAVTLPAGTILPFALTLPNGKSLQAGELGQATQLPQGTVIPEDAVVYVMWDAKTQDLSVMGHQYFAGAGYLFPEAMALFAVDNSWERFAPGFEAPVNYAALIFIGNRSFMVRGVEPDSEKVARAETRAAGPSRPDMLALQNFMGALGIKLKFPPAIDMRENLFDGLSDQDIIEMGIGFFPGNLEQAWQLFLDGEVLRQARKHNVLPEETIRFYQGQRLQKLTAGMEDEAGTEAQEAREVFVSTEAGEAVKHLRAGQEQGHASRFVRKAAAFALANMDPTGISPETVSVLLSALDRTQEIYEEDPEVRAAIAFALGRWAAKRLPDMRCDWDVNRLLDGLQTLHGQENALFEEAKAKGDRVGQRAYGLVRQSLAEAWHQAEVADKAVRVFQALSARTEAMSRESLAEFLLKPQKETALSEVEAKFAKKKKLKKGERKELERARRNDRMRQARIQPALIKLILAGKLQVVETAGRTDQYMLKSDVKNDVVADTEAAVRAADLIDSAL